MQQHDDSKLFFPYFLESLVDYNAIQLGFAALQLEMMAFTRENPLINESEEIPGSFYVSKSFIPHTYRKYGYDKENEESKNLRRWECYCLGYQITKDSTLTCCFVNCQVIDVRRLLPPKTRVDQRRGYYIAIRTVTR